MKAPAPHSVPDWRFSGTVRRLLLIEDNPGDARLIREMLDEQRAYGTTLTHVECMAEADAYLEGNVVDVILLDLGLPDAQGLEAVRRARLVARRAPLVVLTGLDDEGLAARALQEGAQDYLIKGQIETRGLSRALRYAVERKTMEDVLFAQKERAQVTLNSIGDAVVCTNSEGDITFLNLVAEEMTGWQWREAAGRPSTEVLRIVDAVTREPIPNPMELIGQDRAAGSPANSILIRRDGSETPIEHSVAPINDRERRPAGAVIVFRDVSAALTMALRMTHLAEHDFLTGMPNRLLLNARVSQAIALAERHGKSVAVLFLDLDGFKHINDSLGHSTGDKLLQSVAQRLASCVRAGDTVSRQGGDEFVILLSEVERPLDTAATARRILDAVSKAHSVGEHVLHITTSIGVSVYPDDGVVAETLIKNADTAMYQAKESGRHGFQFFTPAMNVRAVERQSIEEDLRSALEANELALHYQPKVDLETGKITGAEALIRWTHRLRGSVSPAEFIPIAEDCGLIVPIGKWVLREACTQARAWREAGLPDMSMAVNISGREIRHTGFLEGVLAILDETGLDPRALELELTESVLMKHAKSTTDLLEALRARGVRLAIDDFGTGYSSLSYLRKVPVDVLKIDQSLVREITASDTTIVTAVINLGRGLGLKVVAEGVETREQLEFLKGRQCDEGQGCYFSRPLPPLEFAALLEQGTARLAGAPPAGLAEAALAL